MVEQVNEVLEQFSISLNPYQFEEVKEHIIYRLLPGEGQDIDGETLQKRKPGREYFGYRIAYYIYLGEVNEGKVSIPVTNELLHVWDIDEKTLFRLAAANTPVRFPVLLQPFSELFSEIGSADGPQMFVLTNEMCFFGASTILYEDVLSWCSNILKGDFWVLPSSVHEVILLAAMSGYEPDFLREMVRTINLEEVHPKDILGEEVLYYDSKCAILRNMI